MWCRGMMRFIVFKILREWFLLNVNSVISWGEQVNFLWGDNDVRFILYQHAKLDFYIATSLKQQFINSSPPPTHYPASEPISLWFFSLMLHAWQRNNKYQLFCLSFKSDLGSNPRSTTLDTTKWGQYSNLKQTFRWSVKVL